MTRRPVRGPPARPTSGPVITVPRRTGRACALRRATVTTAATVVTTRQHPTDDPDGLGPGFMPGPGHVWSAAFQRAPNKADSCFAPAEAEAPMCPSVFV